MNKRIDLSNLGGFPLEQDTLDFMQDSYRGAFGAIAKLCGSKTILYGVEVAGGNVSSGWIAFNGELIPFVGGSVAAQVVITDTPAALQTTFEDGSERNVYFTKTATVGVTGDFPFADLVPLLSLQNVWRPGDIKERYCDAAYIATNFDVDGYGLNAEKGWRILSAAIPATAGKVMVNLDVADAGFHFDEVGKTGGDKFHSLTKNELPAVKIDVPIPAIKTSQTEGGSGKVVGGGGLNEPDALISLQTDNLGNGQPINVMQPYFVILKLIKL